MADMNYVSPLTSDLTDYYTKSEVDELQQGDAATYATSAEIVAGDNAVKGWVVSQGFLTEHQDLTNYATKDYVAAAVEDIETGGVSIEVVDTLPAHPEENVIYLTRKSDSDTDNIYNEWIWVADTESYELIGDTSSGVIPDLSDYATKQWVEAKGYLVSDNLIGYATVSDLADFATKDYVDDELANKANSADLAAVATSGDYEDLSNKPIIPDISNLAAADISFSNPDKYTIYDNPTVQSVLLEVDNNAVRKSRLATVATSGDYNDLANKPSIPSTSGLASESYVDNAVAAITVPTKTSDLTNDSDFIDSGALAPFAQTADLATVATSGSYNDLTDKPTIPAAPDLTPYATKQELTAKADSASLASVATSGDYDDLTNKPTIPVLPTLATVATSGSYNDLSDKPTISESYIGDDGIVVPLTLFNSNPFASAIYKIVSSTDDFQEKFLAGYICRGDTTSTKRLYMDETWFDLHIIKNGDNYSVDLYSSNNIDTSSGKIVWRTGKKSYITLEVRGSNITDAQFKDVFVKLLKDNFLTYSNTTSGLTATTIQAAIDELAAASGGGSSVGYTYDSTTKTVSLSGVSDDNL